jgi:hypothetical protein
MSLLIKPVLKDEVSIDQLKIMTLLQIAWRLRDIIAIISTTRKHTDERINTRAVL